MSGLLRACTRARLLSVARCSPASSSAASGVLRTSSFLSSSSSSAAPLTPLTYQRRSFSTRRALLSATGTTSIDESKWNNVTAGISSKIGKNLHLQPGHPLNIIKNRIEYYFKHRAKEAEKAGIDRSDPKAGLKESHRFEMFDNISPRVTVRENFDQLLFDPAHVGRSPSDTFYYDKENLLRTHTSAHQNQFLQAGHKNFLVVGDCYRRDEIDSSHYPVFHQMEGVRVFPHNHALYNRNKEGVDLVVEDLKDTLDGLIKYLFGTETKVRWIEGSFPFTHPSLEMEIFFQGEWLEVFGCGVIRTEILDNCSPPLAKGQTSGWAFGLGLERLAMILFDIPDIRLFWSEDARFLDQFRSLNEDLDKSNGVFKKIQFQPFSKYPPCFKDVSFWVPQQPSGAAAAGGNETAAVPSFHENDFCSIVREAAGDVVENVTLIDSFVHPKTGATSKCYRVMYRSLTRNLTNEEVDVMQKKVNQEIVQRLGLKLR